MRTMIQFCMRATRKTRLTLSIALIPAFLLKAGLCGLLFGAMPSSVISDTGRLHVAALPPCHRPVDKGSKTPANHECCKVIDAVAIGDSHVLFVALAPAEFSQIERDLALSASARLIQCHDPPINRRLFVLFQNLVI